MADVPILAKSRLNGKDVTLAEHTRDVLRATSVMFGESSQPTRLAQEWLRFFSLDADDFDMFFRNLWLSAATHDIGKANSGYQRTVRHEGEQVIRHEHLSALLLWQEPLQAWLRAHQEHGVDAEIVTAAVASHHLKVNDKEFANRLVDSERAAVRVYTGTTDVAAVLAMAAAQLAAPAPDIAGLDGLWDFSGAIAPAKQRFRESMTLFNRTVRRDERRKRLLLAVKAGLIAADSAGSAIRRVGQDLEEWLRAAFDQPPLTEADIEDGVIAPRVREMQDRERWKGFHDFQLAAGQLGSRALLLSGCGTGKTLAAWKWIAAQLRHRPASRVIFLYPTRATATEGFRDYVSWAGPEVAALVSGTSHYDLEGMFTNPSDPRFGHDYTARERLFALAYWHRRIFSATVDSFLAFMSNRYAALCMVPLLVDSVIVFDEVHSFDNNMFRALERFLTFFDAPALCMTASLPQDRIRILRDECGLQVFPHEPSQFADLHRQAQIPRYRVRRIQEGDGYQIVKDAAQAMKRVLWVVNTVPRCQEVARRLTDELDEAISVLCYHSRFRLMDRRKRHEEVIAMFRERGAAAVLISTQVCEMSLDLDADLLITETAEVPALIQRMGRCCREPVPSPGRIGEVFVYQPANAPPYEPHEIEEGALFAREMETRECVAHADLADYLGGMAVKDPFATGGFTGFVDSGWYAMARDDSFREDDEFTMDCVLDSDLDAYLQTRRSGTGQADGFVVPVPRGLAQPHQALGAHLRMAPSSHYDKRFGFLTTEARRDG